MEHHLIATECHSPYGITQCYLPPDTSEHTPPSPQPVRPCVLDLPTPEEWKAELTYLTCYIQRWFTRPQTVTHPSTNQAQCRLTSLIKPTPLTTTPRCDPAMQTDADWRKHCMMMENEGTWRSGHPRKTWWDCVKGIWRVFSGYRSSETENQIG